MTTLDTILKKHDGVGPGFNLLRLMLALSVIYVHCGLLDGEATATTWWPFGARWALANLAVPMFFATSGFLVTASALRSRVDEFLVNRLVRLVPGLLVVVLVSAFVLGPLVTSLSAGAYFADHGVFRYLLNAVGLHRDGLPGVFAANSEQNVNGSLWTLPHEVVSYLMLSALAIAGALDNRRVVLFGTVALYAIAIGLAFAAAQGLTFPGSTTLTYIFVGRGAAHLVPLFLTGVAFYQYRAEIPYHWLIAVAASLGLVTIAVTGNASWQEQPVVWALTAPMFAYLVVFLGLSRWFVVPLLAGLDYSYGIYLYGFPVQQTLAERMSGSHNYPLFFALSVLLTVPLAALSWHFVEKPALRLRRRLRTAVATLVDRLAAMRAALRLRQARISSGS